MGSKEPLGQILMRNLNSYEENYKQCWRATGVSGRPHGYEGQPPALRQGWFRIFRA